MRLPIIARCGKPQRPWNCVVETHRCSHVLRPLGSVRGQLIDRHNALLPGVAEVAQEGCEWEGRHCVPAGTGEHWT